MNIVAQATGTSREAFLALQNKSLVGSAFTRYKSPADVDLTFEPTLTSRAPHSRSDRLVTVMLNSPRLSRSRRDRPV
jgi:hypothetical protein